MSVQKQTLRANNRALAQNLAKARQEIRRLNTEAQTLRSSNQEYIVELNRLKRLVGIKDEQIQVEVQQRIQVNLII
jgi:cell division protein FtsB